MYAELAADDAGGTATDGDCTSPNSGDGDGVGSGSTAPESRSRHQGLRAECGARKDGAKTHGQN